MSTFAHLLNTIADMVFGLLDRRATMNFDIWKLPVMDSSGFENSDKAVELMQQYLDKDGLAAGSEETASTDDVRNLSVCLKERAPSIERDCEIFLILL